MIDAASRCFSPARLAFVVAATVLTTACGAAPATTLRALGDVTELAAPAAPGSSEAFLAAGEDGVVYLSWLEPMDTSLLASASTRRGAFRMRFAALANGQWSEPRTIAEGERFSANWANFPTLLRMPDGTLAAHWSETRGEDSGFYVSFSRDGGHTWTPPTGGGPGGTGSGSFVALFPWDDATLGGVWLEYAREDPATDTSLPDAMTLRHGRFSVDGQLVARELLDPLVCSCCQNAAAVTDEGPVVVYRGRTPDEVRDIMVTRFAGGRWTQPKPLHDDRWTIAACPVNGPAIAARGNRVVVAWFTGAGEEPKVQVKFSEDAGATFGPAHRVDDGAPIGRVDVAFLADGTALVSWLERTEADADIRVRRFGATGASGPSQTVAASSEQRPSGFPRMVRQGNELLFTWSEPGQPGRIRVARASVPAGARRGD